MRVDSRAPSFQSMLDLESQQRALPSPPVEASLGPLLPLFERERAAGNPLVMGILLHTDGSTYRKPGALMLIASSGEYAGMLSGGCLEGDLKEHAQSVIATGEPKTITYDTRAADDLLWGIGLGCEGAMQIFLLRVEPSSGWEPLAHLAQSLALHRATAVGVVVESTETKVAPGSVVLPESGLKESNRPEPLVGDAGVQAALSAAAMSRRLSWISGGPSPWKMFVLPLSLPPRLLLLGAGPDALPVVDIAARLSWKVTVVDHRTAYAQAAHFLAAERVVISQPAALSDVVDLSCVSAAVVMSHHLPSDLGYLRVLASSEVPYIGLLGPAARREKLLQELEDEAEALRPRLRAPVGLPIGGRSPESIALAIVAQVHAFVHGGG